MAMPLCWMQWEVCLYHCTRDADIVRIVASFGHLSMKETTACHRYREQPTRLGTFDGKADEFARHAYADVFARFERLRVGLMSTSALFLPSLNGRHDGEKKSSSKPAGSLSVIRLFGDARKFRLVGCTSTKMCMTRWKREVLEETGLRVTRFILIPHEDLCTQGGRLLRFVPFCCQHN